MTRAKRKGAPETLGQCFPGEVVRTPVATLMVTGVAGGWPLVRLWDAEGARQVSDAFTARDDLEVLRV